jgi:hypothetical protein
VEEEACSVAAFAGALLHELLHTCLRTGDAFDNEGTCDTTHMIDNAFMWAMAQRYPCLATGKCYWAGEDCVWMNDEDSGYGRPPEGC